MFLQSTKEDDLNNQGWVMIYLKRQHNPAKYRPPVAGKTNAGCERTWEHFLRLLFLR
jgi:hypothetical protein